MISTFCSKRQNKIIELESKTCLRSADKHSVEPVLEEVLGDHQGRSSEQMPHHVE